MAGALAASQLPSPNPSQLKADAWSETSSKLRPSEGAFGAGVAELSATPGWFGGERERGSGTS